MSVVVRMEMPKNCYDCPFSIVDDTEDGAWCNALAQQVYCTSDGRDEDCPIVYALPENHGRLVDMRDIDSMMEDIQTTSDESGLYGLYYRDDFDFDSLPTIVPATEGGKE